MFPLRSKSPDSMPPPTLKELAEIRANRQKALGKMPVEELRNRAAQTDKRPPTRTAQTEEFVRNEAVAAYVKKAAHGSCDLCHQDAPFLNRRGEPYLECHHVQHLAKGGDDTIDNAVALCPNCHRKMHALDLASDRQRLLRRVQERERVFIEPSKL
jgi:5-methylcytosine-specific restriction protein A